MRRLPAVTAILLACAIALAPGLGFARAGSGASMGSRGSFTFSAPPSTATAPRGAMPFERSVTPSAPSYAPSPYGGAPAYGNRSPFMSGLMGGLIGAGIGGLLFGHGLFGGIHGVFGFFGFLLQIFLVIWLVRLAVRFFLNRQPAMAGPGMFARGGMAPGPGPVPGGGGGGRPAVGTLTISPQDYQAFEQLLQNVQAAWSSQDIARLQTLATPEMVSYFSDQLNGFASRGLRNAVTDVRLEQGDLAQAWSEGGREYSTVAMRFSMLDVTRDASGRVVDGDVSLRTMATELWTFVRAPGGRWLLSAIQQAR